MKLDFGTAGPHPSFFTDLPLLVDRLVLVALYKIFIKNFVFLRFKPFDP